MQRKRRPSLEKEHLAISGSEAQTKPDEQKQSDEEVSKIVNKHQATLFCSKPEEQTQSDEEEEDIAIFFMG